VRREAHQRTLGAATDGSRDVRSGRGARAAGKDELLQRCEIGVEALDGVSRGART
jgi:hypothetical protein